MKRFIQGILFIVLLYPLLQSIINIVSQLTEHLCTCIAVKTVEVKKTLEDEDLPLANPIGFQMPSHLEEDEDYDDDDKGEDY